MEMLFPAPIDCPYCGESIEVLIDTSVSGQSYVEHCEVCCRPIAFQIELDHNDNPHIQVSTEDE